MGTFKIKGGNKLHGCITPQGAKNEAMQIICASLLTEEKVTITNLPNISDINNLIDLLKDMGVIVERISNNEVTLQAKDIDFSYFDTEMFREFFYAVSYSAGMNLHLKILDGGNNHHMAEALFKAFGKALDMATMEEPRIKDVWSTKGSL